MKFASVEMNVHSWQGLVAGTCGHQTRYLDQRSAQNPKCIVLIAKMNLQDFTTSSGQKDLPPSHALESTALQKTTFWENEVLHSNSCKKKTAANWTELCEAERFLEILRVLLQRASLPQTVETEPQSTCRLEIQYIFR